MNIILIDDEHRHVLATYNVSKIHPLPLVGEQILMHSNSTQIEGEVVRRYWHLGNDAITVELYLKNVSVLG